MKKNFRKIKNTLIIGFILFNIFIAIMPTISAAGGFTSLQSYVNVYYDTSITNEPIMIRGTGKAIKLNITYGVTAASLFQIGAQFLLAMHYGRTVKIQVEPVEFPDWADVSVSGWPTAKIQQDESSYPVILTIKVDEDAPAFGKGTIKLRTTVPKVGFITGIVDEISIPFNVGYTPIVTHEVVGSESKIIGPMDTAVFPIELTNMGNARTKVTLKISNIPNGWSAIVTDFVILEEGAGSKATVYLTVKPPKTFGYHDDTASISIEYTPQMVERPEFSGPPQPLNVMIDSRGFSFIGIEMIILPIIIIVVILFLVYYVIIKKRLEK
jgi:hypothetical protein